MSPVYGFHLVIVAGGLGSRLAPLTNQIPKFLVNIGKNTGYVEMMRYWLQYSTFAVDPDLGSGVPGGYDPGSLTVIVNAEYAALVAEYHRMYFPKVPLIVKTVTEANGSAHAILSTCSHLEGKSVTFAWCDVYPVDVIPFEEFGPMYAGANVVFTNYNNSNRYELVRTGTGWADVKPTLSPTERGGCFGLYHINSFRTDSVDYKPGQDFIEVIEQYGKIREHRLEKIIDFGDMPKLIRTRSHSDEAREFNSVTFLGDYVLKEATNEQGTKIIEREIDWYQELDSIVGRGERPSVPRAWIATDRSGFFMSRVDGVPVWKAWPDLSPVDRLHVIQQIIDESQKLFNLGRQAVNQNIVTADVRGEASDKLLARYAEIKGMIDAFGEVKFVNGHELSQSDPTQVIKDLTTALENYYKDHREIPYGFIHGDLQMSNAMVDPDTLKVTIIDPRGYFGKTKLLGLRDYDTGKLLYALSGYDLFNYSKDFGISSLKDGHLQFSIPKPSHDGIESVIADHFKQVHYLWLAVCWIGLAQYIKNDPVKSVCAHYHGIALAERFLRLAG